MPAPEQMSKRGVWSRLRRFAIIRIVLALVFVGVSLGVLQFVFETVAAASPQAKQLIDVTRMRAWLGIAVAIVSYRLFVRWVEERRAVELGASGAIRETALGIALGACMFAVTIGILTVAGVYQVTGWNPWPVVIGAMAGAATAAVLEEVIFRGIIFRITEESLGSWWALAISALIFGAVHLLNPEGSMQGAVAIVLEAGIFLAAAYMTTRRLWFVFGAHFGWNFTESGIFGAAVSGNEARGLLKNTLTGPTYLSGGAFGAEASVVAIAVCLLVAVILLWRVKRRGALVAPFWRRAEGAGL